MTNQRTKKTSWQDLKPAIFSFKNLDLVPLYGGYFHVCKCCYLESHMQDFFSHKISYVFFMEAS